MFQKHQTYLLFIFWLLRQTNNPLEPYTNESQMLFLEMEFLFFPSMILYLECEVIKAELL